MNITEEFYRNIAYQCYLTRNRVGDAYEGQFLDFCELWNKQKKRVVDVLNETDRVRRVKEFLIGNTSTLMYIYEVYISWIEEDMKLKFRFTSEQINRIYNDFYFIPGDTILPDYIEPFVVSDNYIRELYKEEGGLGLTDAHYNSLMADFYLIPKHSIPLENFKEI